MNHDVTYEISRAVRARMAINDFFSALRMYKFWAHMAWIDIRVKYRRSVLGPWWITISMAIFVLAMGLVYSKLFHQNLSRYLPFLFSGLINWTFFSTVISESSDILRNSKGFIKQLKIPFFVYFLKLIFRNLIIYAHNFVIYLVILVVFRMDLSWQMLLFLPGLFLVALNLLWASVLIGILSLRYQDIAPIVNSVVMIAFFISPITWRPEQLVSHPHVYQLNPIYYFLEITRGPLLGSATSLFSWFVVAVISLIGGIFAMVVFSRYRHRLALWVE